jgi:tRNA(adenine34) deaminase
MKLALDQAEKARLMDEVPVGAVLVAKSGAVLSQAHNQTIHLSDPTAHAEILTVRKAARKIQNYRLTDTTLYTTIEPCVMCMGALIHARVAGIVFGTSDSGWGGAGSLYDLANDTRLNHRPHITSGVCREECRTLIQDFFKKKRNGQSMRRRSSDCTIEKE